MADSNIEERYPEDGFFYSRRNVRIHQDAIWNGQFGIHFGQRDEKVDHLEDVDSYVDDIIVHTETWKGHLAVLDELFRRLAVAKLTARPTKCIMGAKDIEVIGHRVSNGIKELQKENVKKIENAARPKTKKEVRAFNGLTGYYREFIPNYAAKAAPLTDLTKKGQPNKVPWEQAQEKAYATLKQDLMSEPILHLPDCTKSFVLRTDASDVGLGAVLMQEHEGKLFPVSYASRKLSPRERRYSTIERECLAIVWAIGRFCIYLYGREFLLQTDHQPLQGRRKIDNWGGQYSYIRVLHN